MCKSDARTLTGKRPTAAALQRQHEYMDWLGQLPQPEGDVPPPDNSWSAFMAQRRRAHERARLAQLEEQRKEARHARGLLRRPPRQGPRYGGPIDPELRIVGRPVNPTSKRQQLLAARARRKVECDSSQKRQEARQQQHLAAEMEKQPVSPRSKKRCVEQRWQQQRELELQPWLQKLAAKREHAAR